MHGDVRLAGANVVNEGRVEICWNGLWGFVCDITWGAMDASVVCRQLNFLPESELKCDIICIKLNI